MTSIFDLYPHFLTIVGELTIIFLLAVLVCGFILLLLTIFAIRTGKLLFPKFMRAGLIFLEGMMRGLFKLFGIEDMEFLRIMVTLQNTLNRKAFMATPIPNRAVFVPQCLRAAACPAHLHEEGLKCRSCGLCEVGVAKQRLEGLGYKFFIVPGSSFIKRMVKRYRPKAIIGIGCLIEIKEGTEMAGQLNLISMGVVTSRDGCVETAVNWDKVYEIALLGIEDEKIPEELREFTSEKTS
ncbi:MAG TPA: DUF116 domain-containing protein [Methanospirillum sp.]|nr:DUF116 domain-containing protein [Methanospirillum sp.]